MKLYCMHIKQFGLWSFTIKEKEDEESSSISLNFSFGALCQLLSGQS